MINETINRDASQQVIGFRYQKQRVVLHILDALKKSKEFFFAIEYLDDIYGEITTDNNKITFTEQDKYYDENTSFTFSSEEIYKSLINFLENWLAHKRSGITTFVFVATNKIGKERTTEAIKELGIKLPDTPILKLLNNREYRTDEELLKKITTFIIYRYEEVYKNLENKAYLEEITKLEMEDWINFLDRIEYLFEQDDIDAVKQKCLCEIKNSNYFEEARHKNKEEYINSRIVDLLDERQVNEYPAKFITFSDIKNIFLELAQQEQTKPDDPYWDGFEGEELKDIRGVQEKILAVCSDYKINKLKTLNRRVANAYKEEERSNKSSFLAQKYRIFSKCSELILDKLSEDSKMKFTEDEIDNIIDELCANSSELINELASTYHYPYNNKETIRGMILNLFNECYLAFDSIAEEDE